MQFEKFYWLNHHGIISFLYFGGALNKTIIIPLTLVGYEMIIANLTLHASLAIYHLISNVRSWNNC